MKTTHWLTLAGLMITLGVSPGLAQSNDAGTVVLEHLDSEVLRETRTGVDPRRSVSVYLPPGYAQSERRYPVIYYFHSFYWDNERMFADGAVQRLLDRVIQRGTIRPFILVAGNYSTPTVGSFYENSSTSGRWEDFTIQELVPFIDRRFRTLAQRESRGLAGEFIGGFGAFKFAMRYPDRFSSLYALHPVGTGTGLIPMVSRPDWPRIHRAQSYADLAGDGLSTIFVAMAQAFLPNPDRPPFHCDFIVELANGEARAHPENIRKLQSRFMLERLLETHADGLRQMRGIKFDWGRYDTNQDHVYANQAFTRKLDELGIEHEAEEYRGAVWDKNWIEHGRVEDDLLPFFARHLAFDTTSAPAETR